MDYDEDTVTEDAVDGRTLNTILANKIKSNIYFIKCNFQ